VILVFGAAMYLVRHPGSHSRTVYLVITPFWCTDAGGLHHKVSDRESARRPTFRGGGATMGTHS
jgi:uncharacterized protein YdaU (DUF1376 family)